MSTLAISSPTYDGARLLSDGRALSSAVSRGDWLEGGMAFLNTLGDASAALSDPIGTIARCGLGWVIDHLGPLSSWLEKLTGSEANVQSVSRQWTCAGQTLERTGSALQSRLRDMEGLTGDSVRSYLTFAGEAAGHLSASGGWAQTVSSGLLSASALVSKMQTVVKTAISQVLATAIEAMAVVAASLGLGMGYAIARVVTKVNTVVQKVVKPLQQVLRSVKALTGLVTQLRSVFSRSTELASTLLGNSAAAASAPSATVIDVSGSAAIRNNGSAGMIEAGNVADGFEIVSTVDGTPFTPSVSLHADGTMAGGSAAIMGGSAAALGGLGALGGGLGSVSGGIGSWGGADGASSAHALTPTTMAGTAAMGGASVTSAAGVAASAASHRMMAPGNPIAGAGGRSGEGLRRSTYVRPEVRIEDDEED